MSGIVSEDMKIVNALVPVDGNGTALETDIVSMKGYDKATFIWQIGIANTSSASSVNLICYKGENVTTCAVAFAATGYRAEVTASGDTLEALTAMTADGVSVGSANTLDYNTGLCLIVVEVRAADLAPTVANPYDTVKMGVTLSAHSCLISCCCILTGARYADTAGVSAITD